MKTHQRVWLSCGLLVLMLPLYAGCSSAVFGGISPVPAKFENPEALTLQNRPVVAEATMSPGAGVNHVSGAMNVGKFNEKELEVLRQSLVDSFAGLSAPAGAAPVEVHLHVDRYFSSFSNYEGSILVTVDWCAVRDGQLVADELIYASIYRNSAGGPFATLGGTKDAVNAAFIRHIAQRTLAACGDTTPREPVPHVYPTVEEAVAEFPDKTKSFYLGPLISRQRENAAKQETAAEKIDWAARLGLTKT